MAAHSLWSTVQRCRRPARRGRSLSHRSTLRGSRLARRRGQHGRFPSLCRRKSILRIIESAIIVSHGCMNHRPHVDSDKVGSLVVSARCCQTHDWLAGWWIQEIKMEKRKRRNKNKSSKVTDEVSSVGVKVRHHLPGTKPSPPAGQSNQKATNAFALFHIYPE